GCLVWFLSAPSGVCILFFFFFSGELFYRVHEQLKELYMEKAEFEVHFANQSREQFTPTGIDL
ncbi:hypothetical protein GIX79_10490, partial [Lactobacillus reuteri]